MPKLMASGGMEKVTLSGFRGKHGAKSTQRHFLRSSNDLIGVGGTSRYHVTLGVATREVK
ncbi:MAG: hypothetical protein PVS3B1_13360 [Ktedonobacteraceae bacterium]